MRIVKTAVFFDKKRTLPMAVSANVLTPGFLVLLMKSSIGGCQTLK